MVFDTDVLIWTLRGNEKAAGIMEADGERAVSVLSAMELLQGARNKNDVAVIRRFLLDFDTIPLSEQIGHRAFVYMEQYRLKVSMSATDALIAATVVDRQSVLCTGNTRHYRHIPELTIRSFRP